MSDIVALTFLIVLREGLEALLILGALATFLVRAGGLDRLRALAIGGLAALAASVAVAAAFRDTFADVAGVTQAAILVVAAVLLHINVWMWRYSRLRLWQNGLERQAEGALQADSAFMLAGIAFLTVFREGLEAALFVYVSAAGKIVSWDPVCAGVALAFVALGACYLLMHKLAMRLPLRPLFALSSVLLFMLGLHYAGEATRLFQAAGWLRRTPLELPAWLTGIGIVPSLQVLGVQAALIAITLALLWRPSQTAPS